MNYEFSILSVDEAAHVMTVQYSTQGKQTVVATIPVPMEGEQLQSFVHAHAPLVGWEKEGASYQSVTPGITGAIDPQAPHLTLAEIASAQAAEQAEYNKPENIEARRQAAIQAERDNRLDALSAATGRRNTTLQAMGLSILSKEIDGEQLTGKEVAFKAQLKQIATKIDAIDDAAEQAIANGTEPDEVAWP